MIYMSFRHVMRCTDYINNNEILSTGNSDKITNLCWCQQWARLHWGSCQVKVRQSPGSSDHLSHICISDTLYTDVAKEASTPFDFWHPSNVNRFHAWHVYAFQPVVHIDLCICLSISKCFIYNIYSLITTCEDLYMSLPLSHLCVHICDFAIHFQSVFDFYKMHGYSLICNISNLSCF